jgi:MOSC domain-containing protein YiiM
MMQQVRGKVVRLQIGTPRPLGPEGAPSSIHRGEVAGPVALGVTGFDGDRVGDPKHHGGVQKAVHAYPLAHYATWRQELPETAALMRDGAFGENLTVDGLTESDICIGDSLSLGTALVQVSQGRQPCWKLNAWFERRDMSRQVQDSGRTGWYFRVLTPGAVRAGDDLHLVARPNPDWPLDRVWRLLYRERPEAGTLRTFAALEGLSPSWRALAEKRLELWTVEDWDKRLDG